MRAAIHRWLLTFHAQPCPTGSYSATGNQSSCSKCAAGRFAASVAQSTCESCAPGTYGLLTGGMAACLDCPASTFQTLPGATSCNPCPGDGVDLCWAGSLRASVNHWVGASSVARCAEDRCGAAGECDAGRLPARQNPLCGACQVGCSALAHMLARGSGSDGHHRHRAVALQDGYAEWGMMCMSCGDVQPAGVVLLLVLAALLFCATVLVALRARVSRFRGDPAGFLPPVRTDGCGTIEHRA
jgi:hypothetical protein